MLLPSRPTVIRIIGDARTTDMNRDSEIAVGCRNLTLGELIGDPLVQAMMRSDGVDRASIEALFARVARQRQKNFTK
jgi:hypothetical protein